jgi:OFA family oxalate/formate antiporter-like MFS transporter
LANLKLIPAYGVHTTFMILGVIFLFMTVFGAFLLRNPPAGYKPAGWEPAPAAKAAATTYEFTPGEVLQTPTFYLMWVAYALGCSAGLMVISQLVPFAKSVGIPGAALATMGLVVGAIGNASGRILSGWISDALGRLNVLRLMIAISMIAMPILYKVGGNVAPLYVMVFIVYWCYGTQLSVNASTTSDFWGTKNAGINYGMLFTAWGVAGIIGPRIAGVLFDKYKNYQMAFYWAAGLALIALICELAARRPSVPEGGMAVKKVPTAA